ncbi:MAG TPA: hypothetical protein EYP17_02940 [Candidatus Latescibacteria bacterium]|nr:hypothetical protein [Candidatus Latescibacterota bacterium]
MAKNRFNRISIPVYFWEGIQESVLPELRRRRLELDLGGDASYPTRFVELVNLVAERLEGLRTEVGLRWDLLEVPPDASVAPIFDYWGRDYSRPYEEADNTSDAGALDNLMRWCEGAGPADGERVLQGLLGAFKTILSLREDHRAGYEVLPLWGGGQEVSGAGGGGAPEDHPVQRTVFPNRFPEVWGRDKLRSLN